MKRAGTRKLERGAAALIFVAILIGSIAWFTVGALGNAARATAERDTRTGIALHTAKQALLAYVARQAADTTEDTPGRMPCPESLSQPGTTQVGIAAPTVGFPTCSSVGRLPWKTLGLDPLVDGYNEPLWYAVATGTWALVNTTTTLTINPALGNQLTYNGAANAVVAVIIAPGPPSYTLGMASPPAGCVAVDQQASRNAAPLVVSNFLECGNEAGSYVTIAPTDWGNDRTIAITATEVMDAIAGAVVDRLQRQVAPALADWRANEADTNWGTQFLPYAATFSDPTTNSLCGTYDVREGLIPVTRAASSTCTNWTGGTVTQLLGSLGSASCAQVGGNYQCQYTNLSDTVPLLRARIRASAPNVGQSFRAPIAASDIQVSNGGTVSNFSIDLNDNDGEADIDFRVQMPALLAIGTVVTVTIPNLPDAALLSDARMTWFLNNDWARHTYYVVARGERLESGANCTSPGDNDCLELNGLPASNGNSDDKRFVLALMGKALASQTRSCPTNCDDRSQYIESRNSARIYTQKTIDSAYNDRLATCPFQYTPDAPAAVQVLCN